jgi:hypothetical protein
VIVNALFVPQAVATEPLGEMPPLAPADAAIV